MVADHDRGSQGGRSVSASVWRRAEVLGRHLDHWVHHRRQFVFHHRPGSRAPPGTTIAGVRPVCPSVRGLTLDTAGNVYVVDNDAFQIVKLSPAGKVLARWGAKGHRPGQFAGPEQVAVDRHGAIYVTDNSDNRVERFSPTGHFLGQWGKRKSTALFNPHGIAIGPDDNIYIGTGDGVLKYSTAGRRLAAYPVPNVGFVHGVALDASGDIFTSDWDGHVTKLSPAGRLLRQWHNNKKSLGGSNFAEAVAIDRQGTLYVADYGNDRVDKFSGDLRPEGLLGKANGSGRGRFSAPNGVAAGPDGDIYVADSGNSRIQKLSPDGKVLAVWR